ncbi:hypothetical protein Hanom_Chr05g00420601 [Helianthus anomalus]
MIQRRLCGVRERNGAMSIAPPFPEVPASEGEIWDFDVVGGLRTVYDGDERLLWIYSVSLILGVSWLAFVSLLHVSFKLAMVVAFFPWISMC